MRVWVGIQTFRDDVDANCLGIWKDKKKAIEKLKKTLNYDSEFSEPDAEEPYFGTTEWMVSLQECDFAE